MASKEMLINAIDDEECRVAVLEGGELQELYIERASAEYHVGNIYKGRVTNVEPSIQAAFIDYGQPKNGFLHVSDVVPTYFSVQARSHGHLKPPIQQILKRGQEVIVQVTKEGVGTKGPSMTTYLSIPGRYLVLMPGLNRVGVSRKIEDDDSRHKLRELLEGIERPKNVGIIIRTAGLNQPKTEVRRDLKYLTRVWQMLCDRIKTSKCPAEIFRESDLVVRTIRDIFTSDVERVWVDNPEVARRVHEFLRITMPRYVSRVAHYDDRVPLFHRYGLEEEIEKIYARKVPLPCGGYLVINQTEALVAIDVNSGKFRKESDPEASAFKLNLEAAHEIARQLRLRDLGGVIVMDFVDMRSDRHRRAVEDMLRNELKRDRARSRFLRTSKFGLVEMTRQRMRPSLERATFMDCPSCRGSGLVKTPESMSLDVMRQLALAASQDEIQQVKVTVHPEVAQYIQNRKRRALVQLEERTAKFITVFSDPLLGHEAMALNCLDARGIAVRFDPHEIARLQRTKVFQKRAPEKPQPAVPPQAQPQHEMQQAGQAVAPKQPQPAPGPGPQQPAATVAQAAPGQSPPAHKRRRRGRRGGRKHRRRVATPTDQGPAAPQAPTAETPKETGPSA